MRYHRIKQYNRCVTIGLNSITAWDEILAKATEPKKESCYSVVPDVPVSVHMVSCWKNNWNVMNSPEQKWTKLMITCVWRNSRSLSWETKSTHIKTLLSFFSVLMIYINLHLLKIDINNCRVHTLFNNIDLYAVCYCFMFVL